MGEQHHYPLDDRDPFILRDFEKCIRCRRCVRACDEIQAVNAISMINRGFRSKVATPFDTPLQESVCIFCGQCVSVCPTGALTEKDSAGSGRAWQVTKVTTTCPYCGVGCNFDLNVRDGKVVKVTSNWDAPANKGVTVRQGPLRLAVPAQPRPADQTAGEGLRLEGGQRDGRHAFRRVRATWRPSGTTPWTSWPAGCTRCARPRARRHRRPLLGQVHQRRELPHAEDGAQR